MNKHFEYKFINNQLHWKWLATTHDALVAEMYEAFTFYQKIIIENKPSGILLDERQLDFVYTPDFQSWIDKTIAPKIVEAGVKKFAIIISPDFIINLGVEQVFDEENFQAFQIKFFDSETKAIDWLEN